MFFFFFLGVLIWCPLCCAASQGSPSCPCIDPGLDGQQKRNAAVNSSDCLVGVLPAPTYGFECFNWSHGAGGCKAWDEGRPTCSGPQCSAAWCWVSNSNCELLFQQETTFGVRTFLSYATCNASQGNNNRVNPFIGKTIRLGFPATFEQPYYYPADFTSLTLTTNGQGIGVTGAMVAFALDVLAAAQIEYQVLAVPNASRQLHPNSSFTACVHAVGMGYLDMCIGSFWETAERLSLTPMGPAVFSGGLVLVSKPMEETDSFWDLCLTIFAPFKWSFWLTIFLVMLAFSLLALIQSAVQRGKSYTHHHAFYMVISMLFPNADTPTALGRILFLGMGFLAFITIATYTASLSTLLVLNTRQKAVLQSLGDAVEQKSKVCLLTAIQKTVEALEPRINEVAVYRSSTSNVVSALLQDECVAALIAKDHADRLSNGVWNSSCNIAVADSPVVTVSYSLPMYPSLISTLGYWQRKVLESREWDIYMAQYKELSTCPVKEQTANVVGVTQLLGMFMLAALMVLLWAFANIVSKMARVHGWHEKDPKQGRWQKIQVMIADEMDGDKEHEGESLGGDSDSSGGSASQISKPRLPQSSNCILNLTPCNSISCSSQADDNISSLATVHRGRNAIQTLTCASHP